jgi:hypothetical protein
MDGPALLLQEMAMNEARPPRALVVESDPSLRDLFRILLEGWELRFVSTVSTPPEDAVDLLIIDEGLPPILPEGIPPWVSAWRGRPPTIVFRPVAVPKRLDRYTLVLPKPFPVTLFLAFSELARANRTGEVWPLRGKA